MYEARAYSRTSLANIINKPPPFSRLSIITASRDPPPDAQTPTQPTNVNDSDSHNKQTEDRSNLSSATALQWTLPLYAQHSGQKSHRKYAPKIATTVKMRNTGDIQKFARVGADLPQSHCKR
eukprot:5656437-Pyramimonas_sp.AAC.1